MNSVAKRYAPLNRAHIPGFPNRMPSVDWLTYLPIFKDQKGDDAAIHLVRFHMHVLRLNIEFHEDCLMKMFMASLEDEARFWYEQLPAASISSLRDFHTVFFQQFKESYPLLLLVEDCCECFDNFIQRLERIYGDDQFMDEEIIEVLHENPFQHHIMQESSHMIVTPYVDIEEISTPKFADPETSISFNLGDEPHVDVSFEAFVEDQVLNDAAGFSFDRRDEHIPRYVSKTRSSPLSEAEIDQLLNNHVTTPVQVGVQSLHSHEDIAETSSIIVHEDMSWDFDSHEVDEVVQPVIEPICDEYSDVDDIISLEQPVEDVSEKENDLHTSLGNDLEGFSIVPLKNQSEHHETDFCVVQDVFIPKEHTFMDHFACLLEFSEDLSYILFMTKGDGFRWQGDLSQTHPSFLFEEVECMLQSSLHLLDWLHWKFSVT